MKKVFSEPMICIEYFDDMVIMTSGVGVDWNNEWGDDWNPYGTN